MTTRRKRLIEVAFPLEEVSAHSRREKNIRHGHISTLHIWWARRPLAACRAFIYASLVDDPEDAREREALLREVADLASWDAVHHPEKVVRTKEAGGSGLTGAALLERARRRILECNDGVPPRLLDPFAGGGAIPLEGLRLGCEVEASDLNPVAVLILKGTIEYPQKYGRPLAEQRAQLEGGERDVMAGVAGEVPGYILEADREDDVYPDLGDGPLERAYRENPLAGDVRYWGTWMLERAREELAELYPPDPDGSVPVAYLWSRTIPCPSCGGEMPLIRQYWLARKTNKKVALEPLIDRENNRVDFKIVEGPDVTGDPEKATTSRGDAQCLLCGQVTKVAQVRQAGVDGKIGARLTAVVLEADGKTGKRYRSATKKDHEIFSKAVARVDDLRSEFIGDVPALPSEPIPFDPQNLKVRTYGMMTWQELFNARQLVALTTFARLVREAHQEMLAAGLDAEYAKAVATYLGIVVDRIADRGSTLCRWDTGYEKVNNTFARQALPMVWDYVETAPLAGGSGSVEGALDWVVEITEENPFRESGSAVRRDARHVSGRTNIVVTDPPYYDAINYADLSDYFYVWLKRSLGSSHSEVLGLPLTPKTDQLVMNVYQANGSQGRPSRDTARERYVTGMAESFRAMGGSIEEDGLVGIVFAHTDQDAWATLIEGLLEAGLVPDASWPIDTELQNKVSSLGQARLATSVWMPCRPQAQDAGDAFIGEVLEEMRPVIRDRLLYFWSKGIRGADFFISAIGPALSVFGRYRSVTRPDGTVVSVRDFLNIVREESTDVALEQVLQGADLGVIDPVTRHYVTWVWSYSRAPLDAGEAISLCLATGADYAQIVREGSIAREAKEKSKKVARLRTISERGRRDEHLGQDVPARPATLIDQLHYAALLWSQNRSGELGAYRAQLGETRWTALRTLGQAVAECLPAGDEDKRLINGLLGSNVMATNGRGAATVIADRPRTVNLPGMEREEG